MSEIGKSRSNGCWTCRARRKKCDESLGACRACASRGIHCYGYGPRPQWMDGGPREKKMAQKFKRHLRLQRASISSHANQTLTPENNAEQQSALAALDSISRSPFVGARTPETVAPIDEVPCYAKSPAQPLAGDGWFPLNTFLLQGASSSLMMHYLGHIFPRQFESYCTTFPHHSQGWLLSLLLRSKAFLHASYAMSAHCLSVELDPGCVPARQLADAAEYHCQAAVDHFVALTSTFEASEGLSRSIILSEIFATIWQFICMEIIPTRIGGCMLYLEMTSTYAYPDHHLATPNTTGLLTPGRSPRIQSETPWFDADGSAALTQSTVSALNFFTGVMIWTDVLSCAYLSRTPKFAQRHRYLVSMPNPAIDLCQIVGCENWVVTAILDTALLAQWKAHMEMSNSLSLRELTDRVAKIEQNLADGAASSFGPMNSIRKREYVAASAEHETIRSHIFACAAIVYLHTVFAGINLANEDLRRHIATAIHAFELLDDANQLEHLLWPLCICGSLATETEESQLKTLLDTVDAEVAQRTNFARTISVLEHSWSNRLSVDGKLWFCPWNVSMERLGLDTILI